MSECTCVGCRKNPSLPSNNSKSRKALENNNNFEPIKADGFQDTTVNVGKCGPSWAPVAASPFRHGAFRPSNLRVNLHFPQPTGPQPSTVSGHQFAQCRCGVLLCWHGGTGGGISGSHGAVAWVPQRVDDDEWPEVWTRDPARMASEEERKTQQEIAQQAAVAAAQKGSSSVTWPYIIIDGQKRWWVGDGFLKDLVDVSC